VLKLLTPPLALMLIAMKLLYMEELDDE